MLNGWDGGDASRTRLSRQYKDAGKSALGYATYSISVLVECKAVSYSEKRLTTQLVENEIHSAYECHGASSDLL